MDRLRALANEVERTATIHANAMRNLAQEIEDFKWTGELGGWLAIAEEGSKVALSFNVKPRRIRFVDVAIRAALVAIEQGNAGNVSVFFDDAATMKTADNLLQAWGEGMIHHRWFSPRAVNFDMGNSRHIFLSAPADIAKMSGVIGETIIFARAGGGALELQESSGGKSVLIVVAGDRTKMPYIEV